jgi:hypothetical protein
LDHYQPSLAERQRTAMAAFNRACQQTERTLRAVHESRETRMDAARRLEVLQRQQSALKARARTRATQAALRAVVAHRHPWFLEKVVELLQAADVAVVEHHLENGADAIGVTVAEQPELFLVEDGLLMVPGDEVVRQTRRFCPDTLIAAQTPHADRLGLLLEAGANTVATRLVPPDEVVKQALGLLARR